MEIWCCTFQWDIGVRGWSCVYDALFRQWMVAWAHHPFVPQVSLPLLGVVAPLIKLRASRGYDLAVVVERRDLSAQW